MFPASLAACVPVFIATPTSAWASAGASFVPSPVIATSRPPACSRRMSAILSSGVASARKSSTPDLVGDRLGGERVVARDHHRADPHRRISSKRSRMPSLTTSLRWTTPSARPFSATTSGVPADVPIASTRRGARSGPSRRSRRSTRRSRRRRPCAPSGRRGRRRSSASGPRTGRARRRRDRARGGRTAPSRARRSSGPRASRRRGSRAARRPPAPRSSTPGAGMNSVAWRLPSVIVPVLSSSSRRAVARRLDRAAGERQHVPLHEPVHARDPDRGEQRADRRRDQADEQRHEHDRGLASAGVDRERLQRHDGEQEDDREPGEQDVERDLVRRLAPLGALDERDHPVEERLAGLRGHAHDDLVGEHPRCRRSPPSGRRRTRGSRAPTRP